MQVGEFIRDEIAEPLGIESELCLGVPDKLQSSIAPIKARGLMSVLYQLLMPTWLGGGREPADHPWLLALGLCCLSVASMLGLGNGGKKASLQFGMPGPVTLHGHLQHQLDLFNMKEVRRCEIPSANLHASARAMAKIAGVLAMGGSDGHVTLLSPEGLAEAHAGCVSLNMIAFTPFVFCNAGWCELHGDRAGFVGWMGLGGSAMQWHRSHQIGFAYAMTNLEIAPNNPRSRTLQAAVMRCISELPKDGGHGSGRTMEI